MLGYNKRSYSINEGLNSTKIKLKNMFERKNISTLLVD